MISPRERISLRREALLLWQMLEHDRLAVLQQTDPLHGDRDLRAVDRQQRLITTLARNTQQTAVDTRPVRPTVLIADGVISDCVGLAAAARDDGRLDVVADVFDGDGALGWALIEQPDVVVLSTTLSPRGGIDASERIAMFAPRTRQILLVEDDTIALAPTVNLLLRRGTERHAVIDAMLDLSAA